MGQNFSRPWVWLEVVKTEARLLFLVLGVLAWPNIQSQLRRREGGRHTRLLRPAASSNQHGWPKQKNYTHFFNVFHIIHIHFYTLQGR